jgi:hypothetical protein
MRWMTPLIVALAAACPASAGVADARRAELEASTLRTTGGSLE